MNEQDDEQQRKESERDGNPWLRGCGVAFAVVALIFFFIVGACFINF